jgi:hypothetical protein
MGAGKKVRCKLCQDVIQSKFRHDFQACKCRAIFIDGGDSYTRMGWPTGPMENFIEEVTEPDLDDNGLLRSGN